MEQTHKPWSVFVAILLLLVTIGTQARATPTSATLTYDNPVIQIAPGDTVVVTATLAGPLITNSASQPFDGPPSDFIGGLFYVDGEAARIGSPDFFSEHNVWVTLGYNSEVTLANSTSLANLAVGAESSIDLILGTFHADTTLPLGVYTINFGIDQQCLATLCGGEDRFLDAGTLTIEVTTVPEPASSLPFGFGLIAMCLARRRI